MSFTSSHQTQNQLRDQTNPNNNTVQENLLNSFNPNVAIENSQKESNQTPSALHAKKTTDSCKIDECSIAHSIQIDEIIGEKKGRINFRLNEGLDKQISSIIQNDESSFSQNTILSTNQTKKNELNLFSEIEALKSKENFDCSYFEPILSLSNIFWEFNF
jgi:hypothetical protein